MDAPPAAHRIPEEILANILARLQDENCWRGMWDVESLPALQTCSLVCRHWAQLFRPHMFNDIVIRNETHLNRLLLLLSAPSFVVPSLAECIARVSVDDSGRRQKPWIHRVPRIQPYISPRTRWSTIAVHDVDDSWNSLYGHTPRTLPGNFLKFAAITFTNVRFRRVHDLLRIVSNLPRLLELFCRTISFVDGTVPEEEASSILHGSQQGHKLGYRTLSLELNSHSWPEMDHKRLYLTLFTTILRQNSQTQHVHLLRTILQIPTLFPAIKDDADLIKYSGSSWDGGISVDCGAGYVILDRHHLRVGCEVRSTFSMTPHNLDSFETLLLGLPFTHSTLFQTCDEPVFKEMLDAVVDGRFLPRLYATGHVNIEYAEYDLKTQYDYECRMSDVLALPHGHDVDGHRIVLKASQRFELMRLQTEVERQEYLRRLVTAEEASANVGGEA